MLSDRAPIAALTAVPAVIPATTTAVPPTVSSGAPRGRRRLISPTATRISSRLPKLWATAHPIGKVE
jgi:hypothetical protein